MADFVVRVGKSSDKGVRPNNEDCYVANEELGVFLVADGMGGQEKGEKASGMAAEIIPMIIGEGMERSDDVEETVRLAMLEANKEIIAAGKDQPEGRRMGTTAVLAFYHEGKVFISSLGDSRAYLIRDDNVELLTVDHSVAQALLSSGALTEEEARQSPYQHVLHKFLGCSAMSDEPEVEPFEPKAGDWLVLGSDGLTNHISDDEYREGPREYAGDPQMWAEHLVKTALQNGSNDNVTIVVVAFDPE